MLVAMQIKHSNQLWGHRWVWVSFMIMRLFFIFWRPQIETFAWASYDWRVWPVFPSGHAAGGHREVPGLSVFEFCDPRRRKRTHLAHSHEVSAAASTWWRPNTMPARLARRCCLPRKHWWRRPSPRTELLLVREGQSRSRWQGVAGHMSFRRVPGRVAAFPNEWHHQSWHRGSNTSLFGPALAKDQLCWSWHRCWKQSMFQLVIFGMERLQVSGICEDLLTVLAVAIGNVLICWPEIWGTSECKMVALYLSGFERIGHSESMSLGTSYRLTVRPNMASRIELFSHCLGTGERCKCPGETKLKKWTKLTSSRHFLMGGTDKDCIDDQKLLYLAQHLPTTNCVGPDVVSGSKACFNVLFSGWKGFRYLWFVFIYWQCAQWEFERF